MNNLLDRLFDELEYAVRSQFGEYIVKVSELKSSFFVLIKPKRGKTLRLKGKQMFENLKKITEKIYDKYSRISSAFYRNYFPYFKLIKSYGGYHIHFLVIKKEYRR